MSDFTKNDGSTYDLNVGNTGSEVYGRTITPTTLPLKVVNDGNNLGVLVTSSTASSASSSTTWTPTQVTITTTSGLVLAANANRKGLLITIASGSNVFLSGATPALTTTGFLLTVGLTLSGGGGSIYTGAIYGIVSSGTADVRVVEFT